MAVGAALLAGACDLRHAAVLDPKGPIALAERDLLFDAFCVMMMVIVPVIVLTLLVRLAVSRLQHQGRATRRTGPIRSRIDAVTWLVPAVIVIAVAVLVWRSTHKLDPYRPIASAVPPLDVQVVAQDWKWLFIYPEQGIAVVNQLAFPSRPAGQPADHLRHGDELLLRARSSPARSTPWPACRRACSCWPTSPARSSAATAVQRRRLLRPALRGRGA